MVPLVVVWYGVVVAFWRGEAVIADSVKGLGERKTESDRKYLAVTTLVCLLASWLENWLFWIGYVLMSDPYQG